MSYVDDKLAYVTGDWDEYGTGGGTPHMGIDIACPIGTKLIAPLEGTVVISVSPNAGKVTGILTEDVVIFYCHMSEMYLKSGDKVHKGDVVGLAGLTGRTSGPHVHVGYGQKFSGEREGVGAIRFGDNNYRLTDPKNWFYRQNYFKKLPPA
jgi:murein DD-endopeptidase MepM/ murein hydrolase activator NlpD